MKLISRLLLAVALALAGACAGAAELFQPPSAETALAAIGSLESLPPIARRLLTPDHDFALIERPSPGDWLAEHDEAGQTFAQFVESGAATFWPERNVIYLQPLGAFPAEASPALEELETYAMAFFQLDVRLLLPREIDSLQFHVRINPHTRQPHILTTAVLAALREELPVDAHCLIAVTMTDLYPSPGWNFVFGQASLRERVGVFSFARSDPGFFGDARPDDVNALILQRSGKTLVHEISHTFGLHHCTYFRCVENGSNHQAESDGHPQHLCPVCLRKLQQAVGFDFEERYRDLEYFYSLHDWPEDEAWVARQLAKAKPTVPKIEPPPPPAAPALPPGRRVPPPPLALPPLPKPGPP